jgi:diguanylate cyclase (GGDEF)-like protein
MQSSFRLYDLMSRLGRPASYEGKLMMIAFVGTHVPLLGLLLYVSLTQTESFDRAAGYLLVGLIATILGMLVTVAALHAMLRPIVETSRALRRFLGEQTLPSLPTGYRDQAGLLMADVQLVVGQLSESLGRYRRMASTDLLTGLLNRRNAEQRLGDELARTLRGGNPFSLCYIDVEGLEQIERTHGRDAANRAVLQAATVLSYGIRKGDWSARWANGQFILVLHDVDSSACSLIFERIRVALAAQPLRVDGAPPVPLGVRCAIVSHRVADSPEQLLRRAEAALHRARQAGQALCIEAVG